MGASRRLGLTACLPAGRLEQLPLPDGAGVRAGKATGGRRLEVVWGGVGVGQGMGEELWSPLLGSVPGGASQRPAQSRP